MSEPRKANISLVDGRVIVDLPWPDCMRIDPEYINLGRVAGRIDVLDGGVRIQIKCDNSAAFYRYDSMFDMWFWEESSP